MAAFSGPEIPNNGLVFYYDMNNTQKSWKGIPTTNLTLNNSFYSNWTNSGAGTWNANDTTIPRLFSEYELLSLLLTTDGNLHISCGRANISAGQTYTVSVYFYIPSSARTLAGSPPYIRTDPANTSRGGLTYNGDTNWNNWPRDTWIRVTQTFTNAANDTALYISCYLNTTNNKIYMTAPTVENIGFMTPFVGGAGLSRTNTQALLDLTGQKTITAANLVYASNNTFSFDGTNNYMTIPQPGITVSPNQWSIEMVMYPSSSDFIAISPYSAGIDHYVRYDGASQRINFQITEAGDVNNRARYSTVNSVPLNTFTHITLTMNNLTMKIYINGVLDSSYTETIAIANWDGEWHIGQRPNGTYRMNGRLPLLKVYNREITAVEVRQNFEATRGRYNL